MPFSQGNMGEGENRNQTAYDVEFVQEFILNEGTRSWELQSTHAIVERMAQSLETNWGVMKQDVSKSDGIYCREASLCRQFFEKKPQQYCHLVCLDLLRPTYIPCGNYILAQINMK